ncbi:MAG: hypothetical protein COV91_05980 [Candidatus Taylorbacteria bacterium CG11_big_fil_rev_8_21_14_0_20_46_11]|uniref:Uncharacterized protein n=1 Tax=Candidatus Taylorbacteria bacterium CG11_big_fil_rev_8_21_14_0_20_46_11 TaxID=1975025 RepID=A0A2H0KA29_9BACT|nr:MAG: hypothetical protein COV91_05980 [Candidatus Taylorbacteria bacterium CG11_big_fil_rev_8_21_14_0_20_46_11]
MKIFTFFDKLEDRVRGWLAHIPILYGFIGGVTVVIFWRGIWHTADMFEAKGGIFATFFSAPTSTVISALVLMLTGLFVSFFIGDRIILSGLKHEKKIEEKTEEEVRAEGVLLVDIHKKLERLERSIAELQEKK